MTMALNLDRAMPSRPPGAAPGWVVEDLRFGYPGARRNAVDGVDLQLEPGSFTAVLGPNGSGKSTLLRLLLGTLRPAAGTITLGGRPLARWSRRELARTIGVVAQHEEIAFPLTVRELVGMGRYPHLGALRPAGRSDEAIVERAMARCEVQRFAERPISTLSGGERQRARLARALAQEPLILALDEPTLALDIRHEMEIFELVGALARGGVTVVLVTHNLNLASRYAEKLILMNEGRVEAAGPSGAVLRRELLERVYGWSLRLGSHAGPGPDAGAIQVIPLARDHDDSSRWGSPPTTPEPQPFRDDDDR